MPNRHKPSPKSLTIALSISGELKDEFVRWMQDEGLESVSGATRLLLSAALARWPSFGITRAMMESTNNEVRRTYLQQVLTAMIAVTDGMRTELESLPPPIGFEAHAKEETPE